MNRKNLKMMFWLCLSIAISTAPAQALAGDSGLWFDPTRDGEGLNLNIHDGRVVAFLYTYGEYDCNPVLDNGSPSVGPVAPVVKGNDCDIFGQRWFFISGDKLTDDEASGFLYLTEGVNFPAGIQDPENPFNQIVGEAFPVGIYILRKSAFGGWDLLVLPFGDILDEDDDLFLLRQRDPRQVLPPRLYGRDLLPDVRRQPTQVPLLRQTHA